MRARGLLIVGLVLGCSTTNEGPGPSEEGMFSDEVSVEVDGVLVQCGNMLETNYYWTMAPEGPQQVRIMAVVCMGPQDNPGFDLDSAELINDKYEFPDGEADIRATCAARCLDANDAGTGQAPVCVEDNFAPNLAWGAWAPSDGPNCDSTVLPKVQSAPGLDLKFQGGHS